MPIHPDMRSLAGHRHPRRGAAWAAAVLAAVTLLTACSGTDAVRPGPPAAGTDAAAREVGALTDLAAPAASCVNATPGWSAREESRSGVADLPRGIARTWTPPVVGYLDSTTAVCGQVMTAHLSSDRVDAQVRLRALRVGYYHGSGSRLVWESPVVLVHDERKAQATGPDRVIREDWPAALQFTVGSDWPPGLYAVEVAPLDQTLSPSFIPLVVRTSGARSPYLLVTSDLTWMAYNGYGGRSLYLGPGVDQAERDAARSYVASPDRPLIGSGLEQFFSMDVPVARFLSRHGLAADVTTDSSLDAQPSQLRAQATVLFGGHAEYWTKRMFDAAVVARNAGTNIAFLGANEIYWQGRIERDALGRVTGLTVYKDRSLDRYAAAYPATTTVPWSQPPLNRDPASLSGEAKSVLGVSATYVVATAPAWLFAGTGLAPGKALPMAVGDEGDAQEPPRGSSPPNLQVVLHAVAIEAGRRQPSEITAGYYSAPSGAGVFDAGTTYWACGLDSSCPAWQAPAGTSAALQRLTLNLLQAFAVPRAGRRHPSTATAYQSPSRLAERLPMGGPMSQPAG